jgi:hypothetical protein
MAIQTHVLGIYDEVGRYLGPMPVEIQDRPVGPWDTNGTEPRAVYAFWQPGFDGPGFALYHIQGGASDKSTVCAETLIALGITVPVRMAA